MSLDLEKYTMFKKSKPWGYHPQLVEDEIKKYETALSQVNSKYLEAKQTINNLTAKLDSYQRELREMHIQMSALELPEPEEVIQTHVMEQFKNYNDPKYSPYPEPPKQEDNDSNNLQNEQNEYNNSSDEDLLQDQDLNDDSDNDDFEDLIIEDGTQIIESDGIYSCD